MYSDISHSNVNIQDVRKDFSDMMYKNLNGIMAHDVALRIYRSEGNIDFNAEEIELIKNFSSKLTPIFYDSLLANIVE